MIDRFEKNESQHTKSEYFSELFAEEFYQKLDPNIWGLSIKKTQNHQRNNELNEIISLIDHNLENKDKNIRMQSGRIIYNTMHDLYETYSNQTKNTSQHNHIEETNYFSSIDHDTLKLTINLLDNLWKQKNGSKEFESYNQTFRPEYQYDKTKNTFTPADILKLKEKISSSDIENIKNNFEIPKKREQEFNNLSKSFIPGWCEIKIPDKNNPIDYIVTIPSFTNYDKTAWMGYSTKSFTSWNEAKNFYLTGIDNLSLITNKPIFQLVINENQFRQSTINFSQLENFNPKVYPSEKPEQLPDFAKPYIKLHDKGSKTFENTIKNPNWDKDIFNFITTYTTQFEGQKILKDNNISDISYLTPKEAIILTAEITNNLTKYNQKYKLGNQQETPADKSTVHDLLKEGLNNSGKPSWEGNGVCRNFASITKAIFESLKKNQKKFNLLQNTYCLYENSPHEGYRLSLVTDEEKNKNKDKFSGHAWNSFITISNNETNTVIIDNTWSKRNLDNGQLINLDHTSIRIEPFLNQVASKICENDQINQSQFKAILEYYQLLIDKSDQQKENTIDDHKEYLAFHVMQILHQAKKLPELPEKLPESLAKIYSNIGNDKSKLTKVYPDKGINSPIKDLELLYRINSNKKLLTKPVSSFINRNEYTDYFHLTTNNDGLQKIIIKELAKSNLLQKFISRNQNFKNRVEKLIPALKNLTE